MEPRTASTPLTQNLATLQRTHEVYRRARELAGGGAEPDLPAANGDEDGAATPQRPASTGLRENAERELAASVRQLRAVQAGQQVAAQHAAEEKQKLQAAIREEREKAAQQAAHTQVPAPTWNAQGRAHAVTRHAPRPAHVCPGVAGGA